MNPTFIWYELMTSDQDAAIEFYGKVVGWTARQHPGADFGGHPYMIVSAGEEGVAGVAKLGEAHAGMPPVWLGYIGVPDTDATAKQAVDAGGTLHSGPDNIPGVGRFAMLTDPGGAVFYVMTPLPRDGETPPPGPSYAPGHVGWHELYSGAGQQAAFDFYAALFGWGTLSEMDMGPMGVYRIVSANGERLGGMMDKPPMLPRSTWGYYFAVEDIDAAAERVTANGGTVRMGPMEVPDGSWVVQCADPQGASFSLVSRKA